MSRLEYITKEYNASMENLEDEELIQKYLNRLKTFEEKERFLEYIKSNSEKVKK